MGKKRPEAKGKITSQRMQAFGAVTLQMVDAIRPNLPIQGKVWAKAGESEVDVFRPLDELLPKFGPIWSELWNRSDEELAADNPPALVELVHLWLDLFRVLQWGGRKFKGVPLWTGVSFYGTVIRSMQWEWPDVPELPWELVDSMERAARALLGSKKVAPKKKGRPIDTDEKEDARIFDAWRNGEYRTFEELGKEFRKSKHQIRTIIDRVRKRRSRKEAPDK